MVRLPAFRKPAQRQRQRLRRQIVDADPRQHEKAPSKRVGSMKVSQRTGRQPWFASQRSASPRSASASAFDARLSTRTHGSTRKRRGPGGSRGSPPSVPQARAAPAPAPSTPDCRRGPTAARESAVEAGRIDEGLAEDRAAAVVRLPAFRKPAQRQRQRLRRQIVDADPRQHEKAAVRHRKVQAAAAVSRAPADPFVPRRQLPRRRLEQQNGQGPPAPVADEPADVRAEGPRTAEIMTAVHERFPQGGVLRRRRLQWHFIRPA